MRNFWGSVRHFDVSNITRLLRFGPYSLAALVLLLLTYGAWSLIAYPYNGLEVSNKTGRVNWVDNQGPAAGKIQAGDIIQTIDGTPYLENPSLSGRQPGDKVSYTLYGIVGPIQDENAKGQFKAKVVLESPPFSILWERTSPLLVALTFWILGVLVIALSQPGTQATIFFLFSQCVTAVLGFGAMSTIDVGWASQAFSLLLWWVGPLTVQTHLSFSPAGLRARGRRITLGLYGLALVFSLAALLQVGQSANWFSSFASYLWLGVTLFFSTLLLGMAYWQARNIEVRRKLALISLAAAVGFCPFILFSLLPEAIFGVPILSYQVTFLVLPVLPLAYSYAILRYRLVSLERYFNRSAAYALAATVIGVIYGLVYLIVPQLLPGKNHRLTALGLLAVIGLIFIAHPLYLVVQGWINHLFYGDWYDDRQAVKQISGALSEAGGDADQIAATLCQALQRTMQFEHVGLLMKDGQVVSAQLGLTSTHIARTRMEVQKSAQLLAILTEGGQPEAGPIKDILPHLGDDEPAAPSLLGKRPQLWLLLNGSMGPLGLLVLGERRGGEYDGHDLEVLEVVVRQAKMALENAALDEIRQHSLHVRRLSRQVLRTREDERKRVARELHDQIIQALVGLNYQIAEIRARPGNGEAGELQQVQSDLRLILRDLRTVTAALRPPALDNLGLVDTLQARCAVLAAEMPFQIDFQVYGNVEQEIPEPVALCLFRVFQEALQNAKKHAGASTVLVRLRIAPETISLEIRDNGCGFTPPARLERFTQDYHFGLIGLQELVESAQGSLEVEAAPGLGCRLAASLPVPVTDSSLVSDQVRRGQG